MRIYDECDCFQNFLGNGGGEGGMCAAFKYFPTRGLNDFCLPTVNSLGLPRSRIIETTCSIILIIELLDFFLDLTFSENIYSNAL